MNEGIATVLVSSISNPLGYVTLHLFTGPLFRLSFPLLTLDGLDWFLTLMRAGETKSPAKKAEMAWHQPCKSSLWKGLFSSSPPPHLLTWPSWSLDITTLPSVLPETTQFAPAPFSGRPNFLIRKLSRRPPSQQLRIPQNRD